ncbi:hypothetical protein BASA81_004967 [Batrachochytrium salamandrivorans]|nr:hypothetical protein BASA81_004967 [Batrachochytrium salamandrivorans]
MRVFAVSDLHTDMRANLTWVRDLDQRRWQQDVLIVAGDVSDKLEILLETMQLLKQTFFEVFFVWGNHDVWDVENSLDKMERIRVEMKRIGVRCEPTLVAGKVWIVPLESWHSFSLEREHECALDLNRLYVWRDFDLCHWPQSMVGGSGSVVGGKFDYREKLAESRVVDKFLCERNELMLSKLTPLLGIRHLPVITFSHFVPRHDLNPRTFTRFPELVAVSVSEQLDEQIRLFPPGLSQRGSVLSQVYRSG